MTAPEAVDPAPDPQQAPDRRPSTYVSMPDVPRARIVIYPRRECRRRLSPVEMGPAYADFFLEDTTRHATA